MNQEIQDFNDSQSAVDREICNVLAKEFDKFLPEAERKIWHRHPVWFLDGNPIVGYSRLKAGLQVMFWSGADFEEEQLKPNTGKFKDASIFYSALDEINLEDLQRWLEKSKVIQWDYKNIVKRKGQLLRI